MPSTLSIVKKQEPKHSNETGLQYNDRMFALAADVLKKKKKWSKKEKEEYQEIQKKLGIIRLLKSGDITAVFADNDMKDFSKRLYFELADQFGNDTALKRMLINRLVSAWQSAMAYDRLFHMSRYKETEGNGFTWSYDPDRTRHLAEVRRGLESANNQIVRFSQVLQNLVSPPIQIKATNAFFAQNQQINQTATTNTSENPTSLNAPNAS